MEWIYTEEARARLAKPEFTPEELAEFNIKEEQVRVEKLVPDAALDRSKMSKGGWRMARCRRAGRFLQQRGLEINKFLQALDVDQPDFDWKWHKFEQAHPHWRDFLHHSRV
jgi:hypothetical protein